MFLRNLYLHHFRNYEEASFTFCPGINVIYGDNAQGKTNLLEAIYFLMAGQSFRALQNSDLIRHEHPRTYLEADFIKHGIEQKLRIAFTAKERKIIHNQTIYSSINILLGLLPGVIMAPDDIDLVKGSPQFRRHFLDMHILQHSPLYHHHHIRYSRAMKQRNALLRAKNLLSIESWEHEMATAASSLTQHRTAAISDLSLKGCLFHQKLSSNEEQLKLHYKSQAPTEKTPDQIRSFFLEELKRQRRREIELGNTLTGPHKDDMLLSINTTDARYFASEGQQKSCIAAIRLAEWQRLQALTKETPLMLIDDIGLSLDGKRRDHFLEQLGNLGQVFITSTTPLEIPLKNKEIRHFEIIKGQKLLNSI